MRVRADDPRVVTLALAALTAGALWVALWTSMSGMDAMGAMDGADHMGGMAAPMAPPVLMWLLMMAAMMLPAMAPMMAVYAGLAAKEDRGARLALRIGLFTLGYFALWAGVAVLLALAQTRLAGTPWFTMAGTQAGPLAAGVLLVAAGLWELTPVKHTCLTHCREPLIFLMAHWREGLKGAFPVGLHHGVYCVGCCIAIMGLMFVFGAMTLWWMAAIAVWLLAEKVMPGEGIWAGVTGWILLTAGAAVLLYEVV